MREQVFGFGVHTKVKEAGPLHPPQARVCCNVVIDLRSHSDKHTEEIHRLKLPFEEDPLVNEVRGPSREHIGHGHYCVLELSNPTAIQQERSTCTKRKSVGVW